MEENTKNIPNGSIESPKKSTISSDICSNSSCVKSPPKFTIRITDYSSNVPCSIEHLDTNTIINNGSHSMRKTAAQENTVKSSFINGCSPAKKIKMSEEIPTKRVILVLPNKLPTTKQSAVNEEKKENNSGLNKQIRKYSSPIEKSCQSTTTPIRKTKDNEVLECVTDSKSMDSTKKCRTYKAVHKIPPLIKLENSPVKKNESNILSCNLTTSTPKVKTTDSQAKEINEKNKSILRRSQNLSTRKLIQITNDIPSSPDLQPQPIKIPEKISTMNNNIAISSSLLSSSLLSSPINKTKIITLNKSDSTKNSLRQIKINGLTLKPIDPKLLNDSRFKKIIKFCNRSQMNGIMSKDEITPSTTRISESVVTTTTVESPQQTDQNDKKKYNCTECERLFLKVEGQSRKILDLERVVMELTAASNGNINVNSKIKNEKESKKIEEMNNKNEKLTEELMRERDNSGKLKIDIESRDERIKKLESELMHVSRIFDEIEIKSVSLKELMNDSNTAEEVNELLS